MEEFNQQIIPDYLTYSETNHSSILVQKLQNQREDGRFCDVVLHVQGKLFHAHRSVLAVRSPYFDSVLKKNKAIREQLTVACDNHKIFNDLLNFMYSGTITIDGENVGELLRLSNHLILDSLQSYCEDYLTNFMNLNNCVKIREMSEKYSRHTLKKLSSLFISENWDKILEHNDFLSMQLQNLESILGDKDIVMPKENLLKMITKWVSQDIENREQDLKRLLTIVEWDQIPVESIFNHFQTEKLYEVSARGAFYFLSILKVNNIDLGSKMILYDQLKMELEADGETLDNNNTFMDMAVAVAIDKLEQEDNANGLISETITKTLPETPVKDNNSEPKLPPLKISLPKSTPNVTSPNTEKIRRASNQSKEREEMFQEGDLEDDEFMDFHDDPAPTDSDSSYSEVKPPQTRAKKPLGKKGRPAKRTIRRSSDLQSRKNSTLARKRERLAAAAAAANKIDNSITEEDIMENSAKVDEEGDEKENNHETELSPIPGKRGRKAGKPRKISTTYVDSGTPLTEGDTPKRKRGRPRKTFGVTEDAIPSDLIQFEENSLGEGSNLENNDGDYHHRDSSTDTEPDGTKAKGERHQHPPLTKPYRGRGKCPHCSYVEHSAIRLEKHVARVHAKEIIYNCTLCEYSCNWNREFYIHMKDHFSGPPYTCESCSYTCDRVQLLLKHRMRHTDERPFKCDQCNYTSRTEWNLRIHTRCHTGEKPYQCDLCGRRFSMKAGLDQHVQSHRKDRPFLCDTCGFATKYKSYLVSHMRIHAGTAFRCEYPNCEYFSPKRSQLKAHTRTHKAIRAHICAICGRGFVERSHLVRHERIHLTEKPFKCDHCEYTSSRRDKLKEHTDKHHGTPANGAGAGDVTSTAKSPYKPRKPRRPKAEPPLVYATRTEFTSPQHQSRASEANSQQHEQLAQSQPQQSQSQQSQTTQQPSQENTPQEVSTEVILLHPHSSDFQTTMIYQEHLGHHHHDHNNLIYQNHKHHGTHLNMEASIPANLDQRLIVTTTTGQQMTHHDNQCPQQHADLSGLHVGAFMAVY